MTHESDLTPKSIPATSRDALIGAAVRLFPSKWLAEVSVAEICREAGVSNGLFYRYFKSKEEIFRLILESVVTSIDEMLVATRRETTAEHLRTFVHYVTDYSTDHKDLVAIFREGQYRYYEYEQRLTNTYTEAVSLLLRRKAETAEYLAVAGGLRFCAIRRAFNGTGFDYDTMIGILEKGIFHDAPEPRYDRIFDVVVRPLPIPLEEGTRERLLKAGKRLFGESTFHAVNIHEITGSLGLAVGSFYNHFESKEAFFAEIVELVGKEVRGFISMNLDRGLTRLEQELQGIYLFSFFLTLDKYCYPIVREAEFVLPDKVREYYDTFQAGYEKNLGDLGGLDRSTVINYLMGISHYFGIEVAFEESPQNVRKVVRTLGDYLARGVHVGS
jgi:AcrR family transcriptional regulator